MFFPRKSQSTIWSVLFFIIGGMCTVLIFFHKVFLSRMSIVHAGPGDGKFLIGVLEHWFRFFNGLDSWLTLSMFFPTEGSLGLSDAQFLNALPFSFFRFLGLDIFTSQQCTFIFLCFFGYAGMFFLLRRHFNLSWEISVFGGILACLISPISLVGPHTHFLSIWFIPWLIIFLLSAKKKLRAGNKSSWLPSVAFVIFITLICYSSFYVGWFCIFFICICVLIWLIYNLLSYLKNKYTGHNTISNIKYYRSFFLFYIKYFLVLFSIFLIFFLPFFLTYFPVLQEHGGHSYKKSTIEETLPEPPDLINTSEYNIIWGTLNKNLKLSIRKRFGLPIFTLFSFILSFGICSYVAIKYTRSNLVNTTRYSHSLWRFSFSVLIATGVFISWALMIKIGDLSFWKIVFNIVPGANALRVIYRYNIFLCLPIIIVLSVALQYIIDLINLNRKGGKRFLYMFFVVLICTFIIFEQINIGFPNNFINKNEELEKLERVPSPSKDIHFFFLAPRFDKGHYSVFHTNAIMVSQKLNIPTVNGWSSLLPEKWYLINPKNVSYYYNIGKWLELHNINGGIYELDLFNNVWKGPITSVKLLNCYNIVNLTNYSFSPITVSGFSKPKSFGAFLQGDESKITLHIESEIKTDLNIFLKIAVFKKDNQTKRKLHLSINGKKIETLIFHRDKKIISKNIHIPAHLLKNKLQIEFLFHNKKHTTANPIKKSKVNNNAHILLQEFLIKA